MGMWGTEVERGGGPVPFLVYRQRPSRVTELLEDAQRWADRDHLVQGRRRVTFARMAAAATQVAAYLASQGLRPGDRLLLLARNSPDWVISLWAGLLLGAVVAPGNQWWNEAEIAHAVGLLGPAVIVADADMAKRLPAGLGPAVVAMDDVRAAQDAGGPVPVLAPVPTPAPGSEDDPALIIFTAGTTGLPKAAVLAHRSVIANLHNLMVVSRRLPHQLNTERPPEVILQSGPLFHIGGTQALLLAMLGGNTMVFLEGRFDSGQVLDLIERERVTIWGAVPTMAIRVLEDPTRPGRDLAASPVHLARRLAGHPRGVGPAAGGVPLGPARGVYHLRDDRGRRHCRVRVRRHDGRASRDGRAPLASGGAADREPGRRRRRGDRGAHPRADARLLG